MLDSSPVRVLLSDSGREDFRKDYQEQNPDVKNMCDVCVSMRIQLGSFTFRTIPLALIVEILSLQVGKACGEKWKTMKHEEKVKYYDIATQKRAEFESAMKEYIKKKESRHQEEDSDYESEDY
ncbi:High mobility group B protein 14 [Linum perenne]